MTDALELPLDGPDAGDDGSDYEDRSDAGESDSDGQGKASEIDVGATWTKDQAMDRVKEYVDFTKESTDCKAQQRLINKHIKALSQQLLVWMKHNGVREMRTTVGVLSRRDRQKKDTLKKPFIVAQLRELGKLDEKQAQAIVAALWENRPLVKVEDLKLEKPGAKKRGKAAGGTRTKRAKSAAAASSDDV